MENLKLGDAYELDKFGRYKPIMSLTKESFKEMQLFFLLKIVSDNFDGITAYQLQSNYHFPRSKAIRILDELENKGYLTVNEQIIGGRTNKMYLLTQNGFKFLIELKSKWAERFSMMEELTTRNITSTETKFIIQEVEDCKTKEERLKYMKTIQQKIQGKMTAAENKYTTLLKMKEHIDAMVEKIEVMDDFNKDDVKEFLEILNNKE